MIAKNKAITTKSKQTSPQNRYFFTRLFTRINLVINMQTPYEDNYKALS